MKPFDIETYKADPSREIVTRNGKKARIICTDRVVDNYQIVALIQFSDKEIIQSYTELGHANHGHTDPFDLFFASVKHKGWINIYKDGVGFHGEKIYETELEAKMKCSCTEHVATIKIEWEE